MWENKILPFFKANRFVIDIFKDYWRNSTRSEKIGDIYLPFLISIIFVFFAFSGSMKVDAFLRGFDQINNQVLTIVSILAGFNVASIAVISSSQANIIEHLRKTISDKTGISLFKILITFFTWAVVAQLSILLIGILLSFSSSFLITEQFKSKPIPIWLWSITIIWLATVIHTILISIRNMKMLFLFVTTNKPEKID
jgi:uncharacterized membrane protein